MGIVEVIRAWGGPIGALALALLPFSSVWAKPPMIEVGRSPGSPPPVSADIAGWMRDYGSLVPVVTHPGSGRTAASKRDWTYSIELIRRMVTFFEGFNQNTDPLFQGDFRAEFVHEVNEKWPGVAWVVVADSATIDTGEVLTQTTGAGVGIHLPLLGTRSLSPGPGEGSVYLRLFPFGGDIETVMYGNPTNEVSKLVIRPMAELGGYVNAGPHVTPGFSMLVQPRLDDFSDYRLLAEVSVQFSLDLRGRVIKNVSIVPRCIFDFAAPFQPLERDVTCSVNMQITFPN